MRKRATRPRKLAIPDRSSLIDKALRQQTKVDLIALILRMADEHAVIARELEDQLNIEKPVSQLVPDVSAAIDRATSFDRRKMNRNFDVDWQAYAAVQKGLARLVELGHLADAKSLALHLMKAGSYQVECSDEGLMSDEICDCLRPVIEAVEAAGGSEAAQWARDMSQADRVGVICHEELAELRGES